MLAHSRTRTPASTPAFPSLLTPAGDALDDNRYALCGDAGTRRCKDAEMAVRPVRTHPRLLSVPPPSGPPLRQLPAVTSGPLPRPQPAAKPGLTVTPSLQPRTSRRHKVAGSSSPMALPSSLPAKNATPRRGAASMRRRTRGLSRWSSHRGYRLLFRSPSRTPHTPKNRHSDIYSSLCANWTARRAAAHTPRAEHNPFDLSSDGTRQSLPPSSALLLSVPDARADEAAEIRAIWGTTVNLAEAMKTFREFMLGFERNYRAMYDRECSACTRPLRTPTKDEDVVPAMDQVLNNLMLEIAEQDQAAGVEGMQGPEGEEEIASGHLECHTDKLVCIKGLVICTTLVIPDMKVAFFGCLTCNHTVQVEIDCRKIDEPTGPHDACTSLGTTALVHNCCENPR
ncbi:hypothetical protein EIP86_009071 [Pleurotus ostreatoroseus]|nr:hypothetical protein EIP86_009071 [Pleurotus ostreatoroseus]